MTENTEQPGKATDQKSNLQTACKSCRSSMPAGAVVCPVCGRHSKWWRNQLRIDHIGLLLTCIIILLSYLQFHAASDERAKASEALQRAQNVEQSVNDVQSQVDALRSDIIRAQKNVEELHVLRQAGEQGAENIAETLEQVRSLQDQIEITKKRMGEMDERISDIPLKPTRPILKYLKSKFRRTEAGLRGVILFEATNGLQMSGVEFKVTILPDSNGEIELIRPSMPVSLMVKTRIAADRRQAVLSYTVVGSGNPGISIVVTKPSKLRVEGSPSLEAFEVAAE
ncbi:MAG: hypothetical protein JRK53_13505 [Deltaproteobacteria bacterium]|nr:hypothetical protein [Deltaproteobacteria bacterium]